GGDARPHLPEHARHAAAVFLDVIERPFRVARIAGDLDCEGGILAGHSVVLSCVPLVEQLERGGDGRVVLAFPIVKRDAGSQGEAHVEPREATYRVGSAAVSATTSQSSRAVCHTSKLRAVSCARRAADHVKYAMTKLRPFSGHSVCRAAA